jgi:hypothetical protein
MKHKADFTKRDLFIVLACIFFLLLNIAAIGSNGRERAKRMVCLANLNKLTHAWILYANDNDDKLVNGVAGIDNNQQHHNELPWVNRDWASDWTLGRHLPHDQQEVAIISGALWPYCRNLRLYHCPSARPGELRNYSIVDSMNGYPRAVTFNNILERKVGQTVLWLKKRSEIRTPGPAHRAVFIDEGRVTPYSYAVFYDKMQWWDDPPVRHSDGATLSFADAHSEHWRWKSQETINYGWSRDSTYIGSNYAPSKTETESMEDLLRLQRAVWGQLGYAGY